MRHHASAQPVDRRPTLAVGLLVLALVGGRIAYGAATASSPRTDVRLDIDDLARNDDGSRAVELTDAELEAARLAAADRGMRSGTRWYGGYERDGQRVAVVVHQSRGESGSRYRTEAYRLGAQPRLVAWADAHTTFDKARNALVAEVTSDLGGGPQTARSERELRAKYCTEGVTFTYLSESCLEKQAAALAAVTTCWAASAAAGMLSTGVGWILGGAICATIAAAAANVKCEPIYAYVPPMCFDTAELEDQVSRAEKQAEEKKEQVEESACPSAPAPARVEPRSAPAPDRTPTLCDRRSRP